MKGKIYKITNLVNEKVYIGQTIQTLKQRWWRHCCNSGSTCPYLHNAILKYGKENFKIELLVEVEKGFLDTTEKFYISHYKSTDRHYGYNITEGGKSAGTRKKALSEEDELRVITLKEKGWSVVTLAKEFNIDKSTVKNIFERHNKEMPNKRNLQNRINREEFKNYIISNNPSYKEIEDKFGICKASVYHFLKGLDNLQLKVKLEKRKSNAEIHAKEIIEKYKEGYNIQDLTKIFHSSKKYISNVLYNAGISIQRGRKSIEYNISKSVQTLAG